MQKKRKQDYIPVGCIPPACFYKLPKLALLVFCVTSNRNNLKIVANQMNFNINLYLSRAY